MTQDVLLCLAQKLRPFRYDPSRSFRGWLRTVTQNALADFLADRKRQCSGSGDEAVLEQLRSVEAREDLVERLKDQLKPPGSDILSWSWDVSALLLRLRVPRSSARCQSLGHEVAGRRRRAIACVSPGRAWRIDFQNRMKQG